MDSANFSKELGCNVSSEEFEFAKADGQLVRMPILVLDFEEENIKLRTSDRAEDFLEAAFGCSCSDYLEKLEKTGEEEVLRVEFRSCSGRVVLHDDVGSNGNLSGDALFSFDGHLLWAHISQIESAKELTWCTRFVVSEVFERAMLKLAEYFGFTTGGCCTG